VKSEHPRITLLGNNSGRNLGDAAILSSILENLSQELPTAEFYCPTIAPKWVEKHYGKQYNIKALDVMPWTASIRLLGIPTLRAMAKSDVALICDGIIFGKKLLNPAFNYLITLVFLVPLARLLNCKVICFNCGIGPFPSKLSEWCARSVLSGSSLVTMREEDSTELARAVGYEGPVELTGDSAFINPVSTEERAKQILTEKKANLAIPALGINVTGYIDSWLKKEEKLSDRSAFLDALADGILKAHEKINSPVQNILFSTHPMDEAFTKALADKIGAVVIDNSEFLSHDIQAVMRHCELLMGMRFHSLVLASAVETPVVGLIYAPKVRSFMKDLQCQEFGIELNAVEAESLGQTLSTAWLQRSELKQKQKVVIDRFKSGAYQAGSWLAERFFPESVRGKSAASLSESKKSTVNS
jgi:polysaccharide pyruvyl transferase WcaK-like protein